MQGSGHGSAASSVGDDAAAISHASMRSERACWSSSSTSQRRVSWWSCSLSWRSCSPMASSKLVTASSLPAAEGRRSPGGLADMAGAAGGAPAARSRSRLLQVLVCACGQWTQHTSERPPPGSGCPPLSRSHPAFAQWIAIRDRPRQKHCVSRAGRATGSSVLLSCFKKLYTFI